MNLKMKLRLLLLVSLCLPLLLFAQDSNYEKRPSGNSLKIGLSAGPVFFLGDLGMEAYTPSIDKRLGYSLFAQQNLTKNWSLSLSLSTGKVFGEKQVGTENINFRTSLFSQSLQCRYNFLVPENNGFFVSPFVALGVGAVIFRPKTDMKDENGKTYYYWSDGTIRDLQEIQQNFDNAVTLERDYEYETELRDLNLDGFGKYSQFALSLPFSAGVDLNLNKNFAFRFEGSYHMAFTDYIDNITEESVGNRQGTKGNDNYIYAGVGMLWTISPSEAKVKVRPPKDSDGDGIANEFDKCKRTPKGVSVDEHGCPIENVVKEEPVDEEKEVKEEKEEKIEAKEETTEAETEKEVEEKTIEVITQEEPEASSDKEDLAEVVEEADKKELEAKPDIDGKFHWADLNKNGWIETEEVYHFIDLLLEEDESISVKEIDDLLEYYFEQD